MRGNAWRNVLEEQRARHGKVLFSVTELAHLAGTSRAALNVELARLREQGIISRYAHGLYGLPRVVTPEALVEAIDSHAYITGHYALYRHNLVSQAPAAITCFTDRRSPRARRRDSPLGPLVFVCVRSRVYAPIGAGALAPAAQSLCDYIYLVRREGTAPESLVTFRNLSRLGTPDFAAVLARYPLTVQKHVERLTS